MTTQAHLPPPEAYPDLESIPVELSQEERLYTYWRSLAVPPAKSAERASLTPEHRWRTFERSPRLKAALQYLNEVNEHDYRITRSKIQALILEGIEVARRKDNAKVMIEGARALAEVSGLAAPIPMIRQSTTYAQVNNDNSTNLQLPKIPKDATVAELERLAGRTRVLVASAQRDEVIIDAEVLR